MRDKAADIEARVAARAAAMTDAEVERKMAARAEAEEQKLQKLQDLALEVVDAFGRRPWDAEAYRGSRAEAVVEKVTGGSE